MHLDNYLHHWQRFVDEFNISTEELPRRNKLFAEVCEYDEAVRLSTKEHADDEALDVLITAIALVQSRGIHEPLHACAMKLDRSAERYRKQGGYDGCKQTTARPD